MISQNQRTNIRNPTPFTCMFGLIIARLNRQSFSALVTLTVSLLCLTAILKQPILLPIIIIIGISFVWREQLISSYFKVRRWFSRRGLNTKILQIMGLGLLWPLTLFANPAQAQFFGNAETWMQSNFGNDTGDAIPLVFNVLRGLFLLYVGISLVRVINATRQDEDWQTIARTPLIIIIAVTAGDILTTLITG